jgi:hypothetical protein|tara:strand:+ start:33 stop:227 length:195 start_codon:yes stop_codon:yes gene_type:complete
MINFTHKTAGLVFAGLGVYFLQLDLHNDMHHGNMLLGLSEMTWMWLAMAAVHWLLPECRCKGKT